MKRYDLLLADADGTLLDFEAAERRALLSACQGAGITITAKDAATYQAINDALWKALERGEMTAERLRTLRFEQFLAHLGADADPACVADAFVSALSLQTDEIDGAQAFLAQARQRVPVVIVTNGIASVQRSRFALSPLRHSISGYVISGEIGCAKPDPRMIELALTAGGGVPADRALMLGDSLTSDIAAANAAEVDSCWFNPKGLPNGTPHRPTYTVARLEEVLAWL